VSEAKGKADKAQLSAQDVLLKTNRTRQRVQQSNEELRGLIGQIRDFLTRTSCDFLLCSHVTSCRRSSRFFNRKTITESV